MANNKIVLETGEVLIDLTGDTITSDKVLSGFTFHGKDGEIGIGECEYDVNSQDATIAVAEMLEGKTAYARGVKIEGTMPNNGAIAEAIATLDDEIVIPQGYHDGSGKVTLKNTEQTKLIPSNIREGVTILGVEGTMSGDESEKPEPSKKVYASFEDQVIQPSGDYTCFKEVLINKISISRTENSAGGTTITIGGGNIG